MMTGDGFDWETVESARMADEAEVREKIDGAGNRWQKVYFGGGPHFRNWLDQCRELWGQDNIEVEEVEPTGLKCFVETGEKLYRIWARADARQDGFS